MHLQLLCGQPAFFGVAPNAVRFAMARSEDGQEALTNPVILVGLGKMEITQDPDCTLRVFGIGSTLAVAAYDPVRRAGGVLHAMLPHHNMMTHSPTKFVDT